MKKRKAAALCMLLMFALSLCGCQLARAEFAKPEEERLIGVLVTRDGSNPFQEEAFLSGWEEALADGRVPLHDDMRLYASLQTIQEQDENGEPFARQEYVFEQVAGYRFFTASVTPSNGEAFESSVSDDIFSKVHFDYNHGDALRQTRLSSTLYVAAGQEVIVYYNPVYQSADGRVYAVQGSGFHVGGAAAQQNGTINASATRTINGVKTVEEFEVSLTIEQVDPPSAVAVVEMNAQNGVISTKRYATPKLPKEISVCSDAAYILVESAAQRDGKNEITRSLYGREAESITALSPREDGFLTAHDIPLVFK